MQIYVERFLRTANWLKEISYFQWFYISNKFMKSLCWKSIQVQFILKMQGNYDIHQSSFIKFFGWSAIHVIASSK